MKKKVTFLGLAALLVSVLVMVACGKTQLMMTDEQIAEAMKYRQYTPSNEIVEGNYTAVRTISNFLNKEVTVGKDLIVTEMNGIISYVENDVCRTYEVKGFGSNYKILYLYQDDTKVTEAIPSDINYVEGEKVDPAYRNNANYNGECLAWIYDGKATAIIDKNAGPTCTSIWAYDEQTNEVRLIWADVFDCPIWVNYYA